MSSNENSVVPSGPSCPKTLVPFAGQHWSTLIGRHLQLFSKLPTQFSKTLSKFALKNEGFAVSGSFSGSFAFKLFGHSDSKTNSQTGVSCDPDDKLRCAQLERLMAIERIEEQIQLLKKKMLP